MSILTAEKMFSFVLLHVLIVPFKNVHKKHDIADCYNKAYLEILPNHNEIQDRILFVPTGGLR